MPRSEADYERLVSLLDKAGVQMEGNIGDSTGKLNLETLTGV